MTDQWDGLEWALHLQPCGALLVERTSLFYARLSGVGATVALHLATTGDVARTAAVLNGLEGGEELSEDDLRRWLDSQPATRGWEAALAGRPLRVTGSTEAFVPLSCSLQLTNACNLSCSFCYASSGRPMPTELAPEEWLAVMRRLATAGVAAVTLTGGEPTTARGFPELLATASALFSTVDVFTNGLRVPDSLVRLVSALGNVRCQVSIDGGPARHDAVRGRGGSFAAAIDTVARLAAHDVEVVVTMTVTEESADDVAVVAGHAERAGAALFRVGGVVPVGRGRDGDFGLPAGAAARVERQLADARAGARSLDVQGWDACGDPIEEIREAGERLDFCLPGYLHWHVRADGRVTPCQIEAAGLGHILEDPLEALGAPDRLGAVRAAARSCGCLRHVRLPEDDVPFSRVRHPSRRAEVAPC
jgi:sporulation killing factor system radical SAM maturase